MGKFFDRLFNGDPKKPDFTKANLPGDRLEQFFDVIKIRFAGLITVNLLYIMFLLPLAILGIWIFAIGIPGILETHAADPSFTAEAKLQLLLGHINNYLLIAIPLYAISGPARAGMYYVLRNWSWGEHAQAGREFWHEFKRSWLPAMVYNALSAMLVYAAFFWVSTAYGYLNNSQPVMFYLIVGVVGVVVVLFLITDVLVFPLMATYKLKFRQLLKNAFLMSTLQVYKTLPCVIAGILLAVLLAVLWQFTLVLAMVMGVSLYALAKMLVANSICDKYNQFLTGGTEPTRKGLAPLKTK